MRHIVLRKGHMYLTLFSKCLTSIRSCVSSIGHGQYGETKNYSSQCGLLLQLLKPGHSFSYISFNSLQSNVSPTLTAIAAKLIPGKFSDLSPEHFMLTSFLVRESIQVWPPDFMIAFICPTKPPFWRIVTDNRLIDSDSMFVNSSSG